MKVVKPKPTKTKSHKPKALTVKDVFCTCSPSQFTFRNTKELKASHEIYSQDRATRAIHMGLGIQHPGYNIYVAGIEGTGKTSVIKKFLEEWSQNAPTPCDWLYLYNFQNSESPRAVAVPSGDGRRFKKSMEKLLKMLREEIPLALQSEDYENAVNSLYSSANEAKSKLYGELEKLGKTKDFVIKSTRAGIETIPVVDGRPLSEKDYSKLSEADRGLIEQRRSEFEPEVLDFARKVRAIDKEARDHIENLRDAIGDQIVSSLVDEYLDEHEDNPELVDYLKQFRDDVKEHLLDFAEDEEKEESDLSFLHEERDRFNKYKVNVFIDNSKSEGAPVIIENNPTYYNLFGKIEKNVEHGMYLTDFTMVKSGSIHRANGGYLVLNVLDIFRTGNIWETLKRVLKNRQGFIEDMGEQYSLLPTSGLRPDPIPLDLKVILIGTDDIYHILFHEDEEFHRIFKIKADFDYKMERSKKNIKSYASFIATRSQKEGLLPFDRSAVCAIVEHGTRLVEDQSQLSTQFSAIKDLTIEAHFIAKERGSRTIKRLDVEDALNEKYYRLNLYEEQLMKMIREGDILTKVDGTAIGAINGLAVYDYGDYAFGKIGRITCTTSIGDGGILNIERQSSLSGKIHDKGVFILTGILNALLSRQRKHGLVASLCFEQNYGMIDGDSASVAELVCVISALSGVAIKQNLAITGSINQLGEVQPVGGINEKIEGFFKTCLEIGNSDHYIIMIPHQNQKNLMLHKEAREGIKTGKLKVYPIKHVSEAFELATGVSLGTEEIPFYLDVFPKGSALANIQNKLKEIEEREKKDD
ncbi:Lon protease family protein [Pseudobacteriovorax antillogorgiicola]|uniref:endopeptidase La n=1 Tax=Pseudobacteriovorax antillogorgiicola TaxID=1513793 RepID=A0A1Y6BM19_9BACT|nr:ATP-binding protein [Pseudobacteriovorax antillogorgiicola]TCS55309.1 lon-related putative ATP-dependent protease [Pseudobacteriovorax antillogorgiicola]SMF14384.1 lon-related putative ATP-dependent protease [Pseudobacteriovorax antillogorgiicola]